MLVTRTVWIGTMVGMMVHGAVCGLISGALVGALLGFPVFGIGAIFGLVAGGVTGLGVGTLSGLVLSIVTLLFFHPPDTKRPVSRFKIVARITCAISSVIFTILIVAKVVETNSDPGSTAFVYYKILPPLCALLLSQWICPKIVRWYLQTQHSPA